MSPRVVPVAIVALLFPTIATAQRYDLGQRLRMMERAWDIATPANRAKAVEPLTKAVGYFLAAKTPEAAAALDASRFQLLGNAPPSPAVRWANSLVVHPASRLIDPADGPLEITVAPYYDAQSPIAKGATIRFVFARESGDLLLGELPISVVPSIGTLALDKLPIGDQEIAAELMVDGRPLARYPFSISIVPDLKSRLGRLRDSAASFPDKSSTRRLTLDALGATLRSLAGKYEMETDLPAARLLDQAEMLAKPNGDRALLSPIRSGQYWLTLTTPSGPAPVRLAVPENLKPDQTVPLVVAMHGAGGSENLFFDAYGNGVTARQCRERGWLMVATRAGGILSTAPPVADIVDELARYFPIDRNRIYVVGHSMGAAHAIATAQTSPGRYAAIAALGGGGSVRTPAAVKGLPVFVGCGEQDFALVAAKGLARTLEKAGAAVQYREYSDIEHMVIVQAAIRDVFEFFDRSRKPPAD